MSLVIDASVTMAWCFEDESTDFTRAIFLHVETDGAVVPALWPLEVANTVLVGRRRGRLLPAQAATFLTILRRLPISVDATTHAHAWSSIFHLAESEQLSVYDASYLDLAIRLNLPIATVDARMRGAATRLGIQLVDLPREQVESKTE